jgi:hypothetical protein
VRAESPSCPTSLDVQFNDKSLSYVSHEVNDHKDARPSAIPFHQIVQHGSGQDGFQAAGNINRH